MIRQPPAPGLLFLFVVCFVGLAGCGEPAGGGWVTVLGPTGKPIAFDFLYPENAPILVAADARSGEVLADFDLVTDADDRLRIPALPAGEVAVLMSATCRDLVFPVPLPEEPLRLTLGHPVRLRLTTKGELPPAPLYVKCAVTWRGPGDAPDAVARHRLVTTVTFAPGESETVFHVSVPARYRIIWSLNRTTVRAGSSSTQGIGPSGVGTSILVEDRPKEQEFELFLDPGALADAVQSLKR